MRAVVRITAFFLGAAALFLIVFSAADTGPAFAQAAARPPAGSKIGFVNAQALLRGMPGFAEAESTYAKETRLAQVDAQKLQAVWDSTLQQFQQSQAMMTPSNRTAREKQLTAQADTLQAKLKVLEGRVNAKEQELMSPIQERLRAVIDGVRAEDNFTLIIDLASQFASAIIAYDKSLDITIRVAQRLAGQSN